MASPCRVLMVYPKFIPNSFWNYTEACELVGAKYPAAPLGLITVAALCPKEWDFRLVNRNTESPDRRGPRLGRPGDARRHAEPAAGLPLPDRARAPARQAGLRRRTGRLVEPASLRRGRLPGDRRGRAHHGGFHRRLGARRAQGRVHRGEVQDRRHAEPAAALRPAEARAISLHRRAVLARLPVHLRVLRHHRAVRPRAAHQDQRSDPRRAAGALRPRLSRPRGFRRRQFHRQPQEPAHPDAAAQDVAGGARLSVRVLDRSLDQSRRRRRDAAVDEGCELLRRVRRHREPGSRDPGADAQEAEHQAQHRRERPQDLPLRHVRDGRLHPRLRHREGLGRPVDDRLHRGMLRSDLHGRPALCAARHAAHAPARQGRAAAPGPRHHAGGAGGRPVHARLQLRHQASAARHPHRLPHRADQRVQPGGLCGPAVAPLRDARPLRAAEATRRRRHPQEPRRERALSDRQPAARGARAVLEDLRRGRQEEPRRAAPDRHHDGDLSAPRPVLAST